MWDKKKLKNSLLVDVPIIAEIRMSPLTNDTHYQNVIIIMSISTEHFPTCYFLLRTLTVYLRADRMARNQLSLCTETVTYGVLTHSHTGKK